MPLFSNKFTPKKAPLRKSLITEVGRDADSIAEKDLLQDGTIKLCIGDHEMIFEDGNWVAGRGKILDITKVLSVYIVSNCIKKIFFF